MSLYSHNAHIFQTGGHVEISIARFIVPPALCTRRGFGPLSLAGARARGRRPKGGLLATTSISGGFESATRRTQTGVGSSWILALTLTG